MTEWIKEFSNQNNVPNRCSIMHMYVYEAIASDTFTIEVPIVKWMCTSIIQTAIQDPVIDVLDSYSDSHSVDLAVDTLMLVLHSSHTALKTLVSRVVTKLLKRGYMPTYESLIVMIDSPIHDRSVLNLVPIIVNRLGSLLNTSILHAWMRHVERDTNTNYNKDCTILNLYKQIKYSINIPIDEKGNTLLHWVVQLQKQNLSRKYKKWTNSVIKHFVRYGGDMNYLNYDKTSPNMIKSESSL